VRLEQAIDDLSSEAYNDLEFWILDQVLAKAAAPPVCDDDVAALDAELNAVRVEDRLRLAELKESCASLQGACNARLEEYGERESRGRPRQDSIAGTRRELVWFFDRHYSKNRQRKRGPAGDTLRRDRVEFIKLCAAVCGCPALGKVLADRAVSKLVRGQGGSKKRRA